MRRLFPPPAQCPHCEHERLREIGPLARQARTLSGTVEFERQVFECPRCRRTVAPLDAEMGLEPGAKLTRSVLRKVAYASALSPFVPASRTLAELAGLEVSAAELARSVEQEGRRIEENQRRREEERRRPVSPYRPHGAPEIRCERLVLQADATVALTVAGEEHKSVYCGVAFGLESRGKKGDRPFLTDKRYSASAEDMEDFGPRLKALGFRMGMREAREIAFIGDGARCLWKWAQENLPRGTVLIQDFWHVCEHLAALAQALYGPGWRKRYEGWKRSLRASRLKSILRTLRRERHRQAGPLAEQIDREIAYLQAGGERMDYARFERHGWPIGSGAVEAACKHLVKDRFCVTGARWRRAHIAQMLALRLSIFNDEWDDEWRLLIAA